MIINIDALPIEQHLLGYLPQSSGEPYLKKTVGADTPIAYKWIIFLREEMNNLPIDRNAVNAVCCGIFNEALSFSTMEKIFFRDGSALSKPN